MNQINFKSQLLNILVKLNDFYLSLNQELLFAWRRVLNKQSDNRITTFFKVMIENPATALFLNTVLFWLLSGFLAGHLGIIGMAFSWIAMLNIVMFCVNVLGWIDKLRK